MIRARFTVPCDDYRPMRWPIKHPYWCTGSHDGGSILVAYADDEAEILANWPDAIDIDVHKRDVNDCGFTDRFAEPEWFRKQRGCR